MNFQVVQQFEDPVWVNCNFTNWSEGACIFGGECQFSEFHFP